jgi:dihydrofolate reductase
VTLSLSLVAAADRKLGIGKAGGIPWRLKGDMKWFRELTTCPDPQAVIARYRLDTGHRDTRRFAFDQLPVELGPAGSLPEADAGARNAVLMGRKTWDSLPAAYQPLPGRLNGVLSRTRLAGFQGSHRVWTTLDEALTELRADGSVRNVHVVGGGEIYRLALQRPECRRIFLTSLDAEFPCDTFFPDPGPAFRETASSPVVEENGIAYRFRLLERDP